MRQAMGIMLGVVLLSGCAGLIVHDQDSTGDKVGKVVTRTILAPLTFGMSEIIIMARKSDEEDAAAWKAALANHPTTYYDDPSRYPDPYLGMLSAQPRYPIQFYNFPRGQHLTCQNIGMMTNCY